MASKKNSKTSKTAHVLTLLSGGAPSEERPESPPQDQADTQAAPAPVSSAPEPEPRRPLTPPILEVSRANSEALSSTIQDALENALAEDLLAEMPSVPAEEPAPVEEPAPMEEPVSVEEPVPAEEPVPVEEPAPAEEPAPVEEPVPAEEPVPVEEPAPLPAGQLIDGGKSINVMETLVDEKMARYVQMFGLCRCPRCLADVKALALTNLPAKYVVLPAFAEKTLVDEKMARYVQMFGLCRCPRCLADVKALALTNLPAKYVVLPAFAESPFMEVYRGRYASAVTAQILYACRAVMENPRHTLGENGRPLGL